AFVALQELVVLAQQRKRRGVEKFRLAGAEDTEQLFVFVAMVEALHIGAGRRGVGPHLRGGTCGCGDRGNANTKKSNGAHDYFTSHGRRRSGPSIQHSSTAARGPR